MVVLKRQARYLPAVWPALEDLCGERLRWVSCHVTWLYALARLAGITSSTYLDKASDLKSEQHKQNMLIELRQCSDDGVQKR